MSLLWRRRGELHPDQIHAIEGLPPGGRYILMGPPGSGKTSILLHRGQYLRLRPHSLANVRLITFARTLREFIAISGDDRFPPNLVQTMRAFVNEVFEVYGVSPPSFEDHVKLADQNRERASQALHLINSLGPRVRFDALLVDEIQDLSAEEIQLVERLTPRLMLAGDTRQRLFEARGGVEAALNLGFKEIALKHHFRISPEICRVADNILVQGDFELSEYCHYRGPTPPQPLVNRGLSRTEQIAELMASLDVQLDTYNEPGDLLGVIVWRQDDCDFVYEQLQQSERFRGICRVFHSGVADRQFGEGCRICIVTLQSCKGLEFRALHWLFVDEHPHLNRERAYTVVTRAKTSLNVYHDGELPSFLAGAFPPATGGLFDDDE